MLNKTSVEINQCVGCTRKFFTKSFLCYADGDPLVVDSGRGPPKVSACAYCDVSKSQDAWSVRTGFDWDSSKAPGEDCGEGEGAPPEEKKCDYCGGCHDLCG